MINILDYISGVSDLVATTNAKVAAEAAGAALFMPARHYDWTGIAASFTFGVPVLGEGPGNTIIDVPAINFPAIIIGAKRVQSGFFELRGAGSGTSGGIQFGSAALDATMSGLQDVYVYNVGGTGIRAWNGNFLRLSHIQVTGCQKGFHFHSPTLNNCNGSHFEGPCFAEGNAEEGFYFQDSTQNAGHIAAEGNYGWGVLIETYQATLDIYSESNFAGGATYNTADATVLGGSPTVITDNEAGPWDGVAAGMWLTWDTGAVRECRKVDSVVGAALTIVGANLTAGANKAVQVGGLESGVLLNTATAGSTVSVWDPGGVTSGPRYNGYNSWMRWRNQAAEYDGTAAVLNPDGSKT